MLSNLVRYVEDIHSVGIVRLCCEKSDRAFLEKMRNQWDDSQVDSAFFVKEHTLKFRSGINYLFMSKGVRALKPVRLSPASQPRKEWFQCTPDVVGDLNFPVQ